MIFHVEPGEVVEALRAHLTFTWAGSIVGVAKGELFVVLEAGSVVKAIRVDTSELVTVMVISVPGDPETFAKAWP